MNPEEEKNTTNRGTIGGSAVPLIVFFIFLYLKLAEKKPVSEWSWWWVTSPLWIGFAFGLIILLLVGTAVGVANAVK